MISLNALDNFARDHLLFQAKCIAALQGTGFSTPPTDAEVVVALDRIRRYVLNGSLDEAMSIVEALCPDAVKDPELQLEVRIHKLFELIHMTQVTLKESPQQHKEAVTQALRYSQDLATFALHAFPDAYGQFTQSMMLFAFPDQAVSSDTLTTKRETLAGNLLSLVRMTLGARESCLSFLFRYLLVIYVQLKSPMTNNGEDSAVHNGLIRDLLVQKICEENPTSRISWCTDNASFVKSATREEYSEAEVQALRERVNITRQQSIKSLRFTNGDTFAALRNELGRLRFDEQFFRYLVNDYCTARGLDVCETSGASHEEDSQHQFPYLDSHGEAGDSAVSSVSPSSLNISVCMRKLRVLAAQTDCCDVHGNSIQELLPTTSRRLDFRLSLRQSLCFLRKDEFAASIHHCTEKVGPLARECPDLMPMLSDALLLVVYAHDYKRIRKKEDVAAGTRAQDSETAKEEISPGNVGLDYSEGTNNDSRFEVFLADAYKRVMQYSSIDSILREAYESLETKFGQPKLVQLLKQLLIAHEEWQAKSLMKDQFADRLGITSIRFGLRDSTDNQTPSAIKTDLNWTSSDAANDRAAPARQHERTILALMEFLAMTRTEALSAVRNHPLANDPQAMIEYVLSSMM